MPVHSRFRLHRASRLPGVAVVAPVLIPRAFTSAIGSWRARLTRRRQGAPVGCRAAERDRFDRSTVGGGSSQFGQDFRLLFCTVVPLPIASGI